MAATPTSSSKRDELELARKAGKRDRDRAISLRGRAIRDVTDASGRRVEDILPPAPKPETFGVFAKLVNGNGIVRASARGDLDWDQAQLLWNDLDQARIAGRLPLVEFLVVRSDSDPDPRWANASSGAPVFFFKTTGRVYKTRELAARAFVKQHPDWHGREGGWIYRNNRPIVQGYWKLGQRLEGYELIPVGDGRYAIKANRIPAKEAS